VIAAHLERWAKNEKMKALIAIFAALSVPIMLLNVFGGIVSGIWLVVLGKWNPIFIGILGLFGSSFLLAFAMMPVLLLVLPAAKFAERKNYVAMYIFAFAGSAYTFSVITIWCTAVMWFFLQRATEGALVPLLLWSYGVAIGPLSYMASKESDNEGSVFTVFFAALAYIAAGLWVLFGDPTVLHVVVLMACIMGVGMITMFASSVTKLGGSENA